MKAPQRVSAGGVLLATDALWRLRCVASSPAGGARVFLTGIQALVRLPLLQKRRDRGAGRNTAGFISGYRGSPLGGYDLALWSAKKHLDAHDIVFQPEATDPLAGEESLIATLPMPTLPRIGLVYNILLGGIGGQAW